MKRRIITLLLALTLLPGCGQPSRDTEAEFTIACTTYPVYLLANTLVSDLEGREAVLVIDQQVSCLHDYTLTIRDMKAVEQADVIAINGGELEHFLEDVLEGREVLDCTEGLELLCTEEEHHHEEETEEEHHHHDHGDFDPHAWMSPVYYGQMAENLARQLAEADPDHGEEYLRKGTEIAAELENFYQQLLAEEETAELEHREIITFHDGFAYFADAFHLTIAAAIEEEEGAEASARDLKETIRIVEEHGLPAVFTEENGSSKAADTIARECGVSVYTLSMAMSGQQGDDISAYQQIIRQNLSTISEAYHEK